MAIGTKKIHRQLDGIELEIQTLLFDNVVLIDGEDYFVLKL